MVPWLWVEDHHGISLCVGSCSARNHNLSPWHYFMCWFMFSQKPLSISNSSKKVQRDTYQYLVSVEPEIFTCTWFHICKGAWILENHVSRLWPGLSMDTLSGHAKLFYGCFKANFFILPFWLEKIHSQFQQHESISCCFGGLQNCFVQTLYQLNIQSPLKIIRKLFHYFLQSEPDVFKNYHDTK